MIDVDELIARFWRVWPDVMAVIVGCWLVAGGLFQWSSPGAEIGTAVFLILAALAHLAGRFLGRRRQRRMQP